MTGAVVRPIPRGAAVVVQIEGEIDAANVAIIAHDLARAVSNQTSAVTIDLTRVTYLDSAAVRLLFDLAARLDATRTSLELVAAPGTVARRVIDLCALSTVASITPPEEPRGT